VSPYDVLAIGFGLLGLAALGLESLARANPRRFRPVGEALHAALLMRCGRWITAGRWVTMFGWAWVGFHFLAR
jgi:hypothetical protein